MDIADTTRRAYDLINAGDIDGFGDLMADDFVEHEEMPGLAPSKEGVLDLFRMYRAAFPDLRMNVEEVLVSGDKTVTRVRATGTHDGEWMGMALAVERTEPWPRTLHFTKSTMFSTGSARRSERRSSRRWASRRAHSMTPRARSGSG
jgi:predicted ester cyclase